MNFKDILKMEIDSISLFSKKTVTPSGAIFYDERLADKYFHNYFLVTNEIKDTSDLIAYELEHKNKGFVIFRFEGVDTSHLEYLKDYKEETYGYYVANIADLHFASPNVCDIEIVDPKSDDAFFQFMYQDSLPFGEGYARGNAKRHQEVLIEHKPHFFYLKLTHEHQIIGHINAYIQGSVAKIDEYYVKEDYQKQGFGTALMSNMIDKLKKQSVKEVYLVTDLEDTAKDLYVRMGYKHVGTFKQYQKMFKND